MWILPSVQESPLKSINDDDTDYDHYVFEFQCIGIRWLDQPIGSPIVIVYKRIRKF